MTSTRASASSTAHRSESSSIASSCSLVTSVIRMRLEWKVKRSGSTCSRARSIAGISVSMVVFELGTICPIRNVLLITESPRALIDSHDGVRQPTDFLDGQFDDVTRLQVLRWSLRGTDARRRASGDDVPRLEGHSGGDVCDQIGDREQHVLRVRVLLLHAVHGQRDVEVLGVAEFVSGNDPRTEWGVRVLALREEPLTRPPLVARADVVGDGVAEDIVEGVLNRDLGGGLADHHREFALPVELLGQLSVVSD